MLMTGGQALIQSLKIEGLQTVFGLPGVQLDYMFDALWEERDHFRIMHTRHEQATSYMAYGFTRSTGEIAAFAVVPGPGLLNASAGLATAYACSVPILCVTGQIQSDLIDRGFGALHEVRNQLELISSVVKHAERPMSPQEVPGAVRRAFHAMRTGRPQPAEIEVPPDVLEQVADVTLLEPEQWSRAEEAPGDLDLLRAAAELLGKAESPVIWSGGGVISSRAWPEVRELSRMLAAPVLMSANGRGAVSEREPYGVTGPVAARELLGSADVILVVGSRFYFDPRLGLRIPPETKIVRIDIDQEEIERGRRATVEVRADAKAALGQLVVLVPAHNRRRPSRASEVMALKERVWENAARHQVFAGYAGVIRELLPDDGIFVSESTQLGYWASTNYPVYEPGTYITSGYQGTLGYGFATALGVQVGNSDRTVISVNGDGGFMYNVQELSTQAQQRIPLVTLVFNDNAFGNIRRMQILKYGGHLLASDLHNPDFVQLAESFGVAGYRAEGLDAFRAVLKRAIEAHEPALIEVPVPPAEESGVLAYQQAPPRPQLG